MNRYALTRLVGGFLGVLTICSASVLLAATISMWSYVEEEIQWTRIGLIINVVVMALTATFCLYLSYNPTGDPLEQTSHLEQASKAADMPQSSMEIPSLELLQMEMQTTTSKFIPSSTQNSNNFNKIGEDFVNFGQKADKKFNEIGADMKEGFDKAGEELVKFGQKVDTKFNEIGSNIKEGIDTAGEEFVKFGNIVEEKMLEAVAEAKEELEIFGQKVEIQIAMTKEDDKEEIDKSGQTVQEKMAVAEANIKEGIDRAGKEFEKFGQKIKEGTDLAYQELVKFGQNIEKNMGKKEEKPKKSKLKKIFNYLKYFNCSKSSSGCSCKLCGTCKRLCNCCSMNCCPIYF